MSAAVTFRDMLAGDVVQLALQPSQHAYLGITRAVHGIEDGEELVAGGPAWTAIAADGRILACFGAKFLWPPKGDFTGHAVLWALLAAGLGFAQVALSRFIAERIAGSDIARLEAIVRADVAAEPRWAAAVGMKRRAVLRRWGPEGADHILFERIL